MTTTVKFIGSFRSILGKDRLLLKPKNATPLRTMIKRIVKEYPKLERVLIDPEIQEPKTSMLILVNGKEISVLNNLETTVKDGDEVVLVPVVHGG